MKTKALMLLFCLMSCGCVCVPTVMKERITVVQKPPYDCGPQIEVMIEADYVF